MFGQRFRSVSGESPGARGWAGPRLRTARFAPGILSPGAGELRDLVPALHLPTREIGGRKKGWTPRLGTQDV